jgi:hypothetical protein
MGISTGTSRGGDYTLNVSWEVPGPHFWRSPMTCNNDRVRIHPDGGLGSAARDAYMVVQPEKRVLGSSGVISCCGMRDALMYRHLNGMFFLRRVTGTATLKRTPCWFQILTEAYSLISKSYCLTRRNLPVIIPLDLHNLHAIKS